VSIAPFTIAFPVVREIVRYLDWRRDRSDFTPLDPVTLTEQEFQHPAIVSHVDDPIMRTDERP
jgi:hypothetical protein